MGYMCVLAQIFAQRREQAVRVSSGLELGVHKALELQSLADTVINLLLISWAYTKTLCLHHADTRALL